MNKKTLLVGGILVLLIASILVSLFLNKDGKKIDKDEMNNEEMKQEEMNDEIMNSEETKQEEMNKETINDDDMRKDEAENENDGALAPDFKLKNMNGDYVTLSDLRGEKVYLKFWASWCSTCIDGLDELDELFIMETDFKMYTIVMPGINGEMDIEKFSEWIKERGNENIEILFDYDGNIARDYGIRAVPTSIFIGTDGVNVKSLLGHVGNEQIINEFEAVK